MKTLILIVAALQAVSGQVQVRLPFLNPAGVTYVNGPAPVGLAAGPVAAPFAAAPGLQYAPRFAAPALQYAPRFAAPALQYAPRFAAPLAAPAVAAVPTVHHVPGVADVPFTKVEAQPAYVQQLVDVAKPAVSTRRFQVRRPAIAKQFYDIEERVIVRPAGSALVELEEPLSKTQQGPAAISPAAHALPVAGPAVAHAPLAYAGPAVAHAPLAYAAPAIPAYAASPVLHAAPVGPAPTGPAPPPGAPLPSQGPYPGAIEQDSVVIDNPEFRRGPPPQQPQPQPQARGPAPQGPPPGANPPPPPGPPGPEARGAPIALRGPAPQDVFPSIRNIPEVNHANQARLIELLTARGGVAEVGFPAPGRAAPPPQGPPAEVRARVLSATPAPPHADPQSERVQTRRIVVSRPVQTVQDIDLVEPVTKYERVAVNHPTYIKTARVGVARVPTSIPVPGKAFVPAVAPALSYAHAPGLPYALG